MKIWDLIRIANRNLFRNKLRTFLTVIAIFVGSFTLTMTNGLADGMRQYVESQVKNFEGDTIIIVRKKIEPPPGGPSGDSPAEYKDATDEDVAADLDPNSILLTVPQMELAIRDIPGVKSLTPRYNLDAEYITLNDGKKYKLDVGTLSEGISQKTEAGTGIDGSGQIVIPIGLARAFDQNIGNLVNQIATVAYKASDGTIRTIPLRIAGVATKGFMANHYSFVDISTAKTIHNDQRREPGDDKFTGFDLQMDTSDAVRLEQVKTSLDKKGFSGETIADARKRTYDAIGIFKIGINLFAFVALLAASFGIINTLVIAVLERTKEIGLQKALGMGRGKIFMIFSFESILIGFWGALLGTIGGIAVGIMANKVLVSGYLPSFEGLNLFAFTLPSIASVMILVCAIAFLAGVLPAFRASRLNPIDSLRYE